MTAFCRSEGIKLLAYGTLAGGLLSEKWLGKSEPAAGDLADWSTMKYKRFVDAIGGWEVLQDILRAPAGGRAEARRLDGQRGDALGPRPARGRAR